MISNVKESDEASDKAENSSDIQTRKRKPYDHWNFTKLKVINYSYAWTIDNFSVFLISNYKLQSPQFTPSFRGSTFTFFMHLVPATDKKSFTTTFMSRHNDNTSAFRFKISIVNSRGELTNTKEFERSLHLHSNNFDTSFTTQNDIFDAEIGLLSDDKLTFLCEVKGIFGVENYIIKSQNISGSDSKLVTDFANILNNDVLSDMTFVIGNRKFHAHKAILAGRSPVFAAMFESDMEESHLNTVTVTDINPDIFKEVLKYIYTGKVDNLNELAAGLYAASDKYDLEILKKYCANYLFDNLTEKSVIETLILADRHCDEYLKNKIINSHIKANATTIMKSEDWQAMVASHPHLIDEVLQLLLKS